MISPQQMAAQTNGAATWAQQNPTADRQVWYPPFMQQGTAQQGQFAQQGLNPQEILNDISRILPVVISAVSAQRQQNVVGQQGQYAPQGFMGQQGLQGQFAQQGINPQEILNDISRILPVVISTVSSLRQQNVTGQQGQYAQQNPFAQFGQFGQQNPLGQLGQFGQQGQFAQQGLNPQEILNDISRVLPVVIGAVSSLRQQGQIGQQNPFAQQGQYAQQNPFAQQGQYAQQNPFAQQGQYHQAGMTQQDILGDISRILPTVIGVISSLRYQG